MKYLITPLSNMMVLLLTQAAERMKCRSQNTWLEVETDSVSIATTSAMGGISHVSYLTVMYTVKQLVYNGK